MKNTAIHSRELQHLVEIYELEQNAINDFGGTVSKYNFKRKAWAKVEYKDANQRYDQAGMTNFDEQMIFTMRYDNNLSNFPERYFLVWNNYKFIIQKASCQDINKVYFTLSCIQESTTEFVVENRIITEAGNIDIISEDNKILVTQ